MEMEMVMEMDKAAANAKSERRHVNECGCAPLITCASSEALSNIQADLDEGEMVLDRLFPDVSLEPSPLRSDELKEETITANTDSIYDSEAANTDSDSDSDSDYEEMQLYCDFCGSTHKYEMDVDGLCNICGSERHSAVDCSYYLNYFPPGAKIFNPCNWKEICDYCEGEMVDEKCPNGCPPFGYGRHILPRRVRSVDYYDPTDPGPDWSSMHSELLLY